MSLRSLSLTQGAETQLGLIAKLGENPYLQTKLGS